MPQDIEITCDRNGVSRGIATVRYGPSGIGDAEFARPLIARLDSKFVVQFLRVGMLAQRTTSHWCVAIDSHNLASCCSG
jgi:hypothetical protein